MRVLNELSILMVFNLVDMVKIAIEEGTYHKSQEWCHLNNHKYLVAGSQELW